MDRRVWWACPLCGWRRDLRTGGDCRGSLDFVEVTRHQTKRDRKADGTWAFYARHTLTCRSTDTVHDWWEPLTPTQTDEVHKFNRSDYLRVLPPTDPDFSRVYGMRADTESLNAQFERAFYNRRLPAWGLHTRRSSCSWRRLLRMPGLATPGSGRSTDNNHRHR